MTFKTIPAISITAFARIYKSQWQAQGLFVSDELSIVPGLPWPIRTDGFIIGICSQGTARFELNFQSYHAQQHCLLATTPRHLYKLADISEDFLCRFIVFSKAFLVANNINIHLLDSFRFLEAMAAPVTQLQAKEAKGLLDFFTFIEQKFRQQEHPYRSEIIRNLLLSLLYEIEAAYQQQTYSTGKKLNRREELNAQFHNLLFRHYKEQRSVRFYADQLFVTPKHLTETVKEVSGRPASKWIEDAVVLEAKALLKHPSLNVVRVAEILHFPNPSFFGKYFKKVAGVSPSEYRKG